MSTVGTATPPSTGRCRCDVCASGVVRTEPAPRPGRFDASTVEPHLGTAPHLDEWPKKTVPELIVDITNRLNEKRIIFSRDVFHQREAPTGYGTSGAGGRDADPPRRQCPESRHGRQPLCDFIGWDVREVTDTHNRTVHVIEKPRRPILAHRDERESKATGMDWTRRWALEDVETLVVIVQSIVAEVLDDVPAGVEVRHVTLPEDLRCRYERTCRMLASAVDDAREMGVEIPPAAERGPGRSFRALRPHESATN